MPAETVNVVELPEDKMTDTSSGCCSPAWLAEQLDQCCGDIVLLDCRTSCDYNTSHVDMAIHIALPSIMLRRLKNGSLSVASVINCNEAKERFLNTYKAGTVVIYDECTSGVNANPSSVISVLRRKLKDDGCRVFVLEGGFAAFCEQYPEQCTCLKDESETTIMGLSSLRISDTHDLITPTSGSTPGSGDSPFPVEVLPCLFLGNAKNSADLECLYKNRITHIINVTQDVPNTFEMHKDFKYLQIPITDHWSENLSAFFPKAFAFIDEARNEKSGVLVHCLAGISRSVTVTVAYLMYTLSLSLNDAYDFVKRCKPNISPNFNFMGQLLDFEKTLTRNTKTCVCPVDVYPCACRQITTYFSTPTFTLPAVGVPIETTPPS